MWWAYFVRLSFTKVCNTQELSLLYVVQSVQSSSSSFQSGVYHRKPLQKPGYCNKKDLVTTTLNVSPYMCKALTEVL